MPCAVCAGDWEFSGAVQHESLFPTTDITNDRTSPREPWALIDHLSNSYVDVGVRWKQTIDAAVRVELMQWPMLGFEPDFKGHGIGHLHVAGHWRWGDITVGDVYGQFGSGLILRLYEERALGLDNALRGAKIDLHPIDGLLIEALGGKQRRYWNCYQDRAWGWNYSQDAVMGVNAEVNIDRWIKPMQEAQAHLMLGGSYVTKYQAFDTIYTTVNNQLYYYNLPTWVGAGDVRAEFQMHGWDALVEYAYKANDPVEDNHYSYRPGSALLTSLSYSRKGLSVLVQAKRSENMSFRSDRHRTGIAGQLNHLPSFTTQHTYALATLNSYATQMDGEWAFQGEIRYSWKGGKGVLIPERGTIGRAVQKGSKGTTLKLGVSHIRGLGKKWLEMSKDPYFTDVHLELNQRLSKDWYLNALLRYETYNQQVVEGHGEIIRSGLGVVDVKWKTSKHVQMRAELQYLFSRQGTGQWIYAAYELSLFKQVMLSLSDMYCIGHGSPTAEPEQGNHYYSAMVTWQHGAHRLSAGYMKTMAGYNCSGGVCRYVPQQEGVMVTYDYTW